MDIHRCRFVEFPPSAINALAFSHSSGSAGNSQPLRLAVGRANGDIEIWDPQRGAWIHEITLRGGKERTVDGLAWVHDPDEQDEGGYVTRGKLRLFSIGYSSSVTEWDLLTGLPLRQSSGSHSEIWCLAAQPRWNARKNAQGGTAAALEGEAHVQDLVVGCADGTLVQLSTADNDLLFKKYIARSSKKNARALSIAFQSRDVVIVGFGDSHIRVYDIRSGSLLRTMSLGVGSRSGPKESLIWAVDCLRNGTIVAGDSRGEVSFWDGKNYTQLQKIKGHDADILCLASSEDGNTVFSAGMDRRTTVYQLGGAAGQRRRWAKTTHRRYHQHDVKAMARFENSNTSIVVSGGLDTTLIIVPVREYGMEHHRTLPYTPQDPPMTSAGRMLVSWWNNEIRIWRVNPRQAGPDMIHPTDEANYKSLAELAMKGDEHINSLSLSPSGRIMAVSTSSEIKLFALRPVTSERGEQLKIVKLDTPQALQKIGARLVQLSPDAKWLLYIGLDNQPYVARLYTNADALEEVAVLPNIISLRRFVRQPSPQNCLNGAAGSYDRTITRAAFASDSRILAVSDLAGYIDTWVLSGHEDSTAPVVDIATSRESATTKPPPASDDESDDDDENHELFIFHGQHWIQSPAGALLPRLPSTPLVMSFRPTNHTSRNGHLPNGNPAVHPTRHNPHAHAHSLPGSDSEDRLFILTAAHAAYELEVLRGRMTDWSRQNPPEALPKSFRLQRDRAVGCVWDVRDVPEPDTHAPIPKTAARIERARIWLYATSWICMFDLRATAGAIEEGVDTKSTFTALQPLRGQKRKTEERSQEQLQTKRHTTGAGSRVPDAEMGGKRTRSMRTLDGDGDDEAGWLQLPAQTRNGITSDDDDDDAEDAMDIDDEDGIPGVNGGTALQRHRNTNDHSDVDKTDDHSKAVTFFLTNRYRPILGMVPLQIETGTDDTLEVALVERPPWDLALPPRFRGARE